MLVEYALTPDIFDSSCYSNSALCRIYLQNLKEPLLQEGLVRDLRDGGWSNYVRDETFPSDKMGKELLKKLKSQNRLRRFPASSGKEPQIYPEWCLEALASDQRSLKGIISSEALKKEFVDRNEVGSIEKLYQSLWWQERSSSKRISRQLDDYLEKLHLVLTQAIYLYFIDPNINPGKNNYKDFYKLLIAAKRTDIQPKIQIHRKCKDKIGSAKHPEIIDNETWEKIFRDSLGEKLSKEGLNAEVFIWDEFHDRYLITNLIGINLPYGFDTSTNPNAKTTWCRLGQKDREDIEREFEAAAKHHKLQHRFLIIE